MNSYISNLKNVISTLRKNNIAAEIRGEGASSFIYAENEGRAIELSWDGIGIFVGMFEEPNETSVRDEVQNTFEIGAEVALGWLLKHE
jgi:hypothetical protein